MCVVVNVGLVEVFARDILVRRVRVLDPRVVVLVPVGRQQVFDDGPRVGVVRHVRVLVPMDNGRMRMCFESLPWHAGPSLVPESAAAQTTLDHEGAAVTSTFLPAVFGVLGIRTSTTPSLAVAVTASVLQPSGSVTDRKMWPKLRSER